MKTIIKCITLLFIFFSGVYHVNAAAYTEIWDASHNANYAASIVAIMDAYTLANPIFNPADIPVINTQVAELFPWAWAQVYLSGTQLILGCSNEPIVSYSVVLLPPPPPVITYSTSPDSCIYISDYSPLWSDCSINSNWTTAGTINCSQTNTWQANSASANWTCTTTYVDGVASGTSCNGGCPWNASQPAIATETKTINLQLSSSAYSTCNNSTYANNSDTCTVSMNVIAGTNQNKGITGWGGHSILSNIVDTSNIRANRIDSSQPGNAMNFSNVSSSGIPTSTSNNFTININNIKSVSPFSSTTGKMTFQLGGTSMELSNIPYSFNKPFIGTLWINGGDSLNVWTEQTAEMRIIQKSTINPSYTINTFLSTLNPVDTTNFLIQNKNSETGLTGIPQVNFTLNYKGTANISKTTLRADPQIYYSLGGRDVRYYLSQTESPTDRYLDTGVSEFLWVRVVGQIQGQGKQVITGQIKNFSDISLFDIRSSVKKNVTDMTRGMKNGDIFNGVKYVEWDITLFGDQSYELLVVRNGNVIISDNLNTVGQKFGIIALRDDQSRTDIGNIYVKNTVTKIQAYICADGGFMSADSAGNPYIQNTITRTNALKIQLILKGLLLTRNTIGWAIGDSGSYILPGGSKTSDLDKSIMYDLNYVRRGYTGWDKNGNGTLDTGEYKDPFVIIYDDVIQNNPPKAFSVK